MAAPSPSTRWALATERLVLPPSTRENKVATDHPLDLLVRRLDANTPLPAEDRAALRALPFTTRTVPPATSLMREGDPATNCSVLVTGFAFRHKMAYSGARQIVSLHIPGEALDFQSLRLTYVDHNLQTLTHAEIATIPMVALRQLLDARPAIANAVLYNLLVEASILREWVLNVGRRSARERLAHLLCEYAFRLDQQGLSDGQGYELRMTQEQIGDALGLTAVHVNRSIKALQTEGLIKRDGRLLTFPDTDKLRKVADFSELYLHATG